MGVHSYALPNKGNDYVYLKDLQLSAVVGQDAWGRTGKEQPVFLSVKWFHDLGGTDRLEETLSYSKMAKDIIESIKSRNGGFNSVQSLAEFIVYVAIDKDWKGAALLVEAHLPKALLEAANGLKFSRGHYLQELNSERQPFDARELYPRVTLEDIRLLCIIGVNPHERETKQAVRVDMSIEEDLSMGAADGIATHWRGLVHHVVQIVEASSFQTVEALATDIATVLLDKWPARLVSISVEKPNALPFVTASGACVTRLK